MKNKRGKDFLFYLFWTAVLIIVTSLVIVTLEFSNLLPFLSNRELLVAEPVAEPPLPRIQENTTLPVPAYFQNIRLEGDSEFLRDEGTSFQAGYIVLEANFPEDFDLDPALLPASLHNTNPFTVVNIRITVGWNNLPRFDQLLEQSSSSVSLKLSHLDTIQFQFSGLREFNFRDNQHLKRVLQTEINAALRGGRIDNAVVRRAIELLGTHYTLRGIENITIEYHPASAPPPSTQQSSIQHTLTHSRYYEFVSTRKIHHANIH